MQKEKPHGKKNNHATKGKTSRLKEKDSRQKEKPHGKKKRKYSRQKEKPHDKKKRTHGKKKNLMARRKRLAVQRKTRSKISSMPRGHFICFFCREVIPFAVRLFFLP